MGAPLGFKTFTTGDVLTAADTNGYLMQGVWTFASAAARDAAVTSPQEGNVCYLKDTDAVMTYSGSAWVAVGGTATFNTGFNSVATQENTTSATYTGLTTALAVTVTTGTKALVIISGAFQNGSLASAGFMSYAISGATTVAASDDWGIASYLGTATNFQDRKSAARLVTGLTAGSNTFTTQYRSGTGTIYYSLRNITVINMGS